MILGVQLPVFPVHPWRRRLAGLTLVVLAVILPALVAGRQLDREPVAGELRHLAQASAPLQEGVALDPELRTSSVARLFYRLTLGPAGGDEHQRLARARRAQILAIAGLGMLAYLVGSLYRNRRAGILAALALAVTGPVFDAGFALRPETPMAVCGGLTALLLLLHLPRKGRRRGVVRAGTAVAAGVAAGLGTAVLPVRPEALLLPVLCFLVSGLILVPPLVRIVRRRRYLLFPLRAVPRRLLPWALAAFCSLAASAALLPSALEGAGAAVRATVPLSTLFPAGWGFILWVPATLGFARLLYRGGITLARTRKVQADTVILAFILLALGLPVARGVAWDPMPVALPAGLVVGEGVAILWFLLRWLVRGRN